MLFPTHPERPHTWQSLHCVEAEAGVFNHHSSTQLQTPADVSAQQADSSRQEQLLWDTQLHPCVHAETLSPSTPPPQNTHLHTHSTAKAHLHSSPLPPNSAPPLTPPPKALTCFAAMRHFSFEMSAGSPCSSGRSSLAGSTANGSCPPAARIATTCRMSQQCHHHHQQQQQQPA